MTMRTDSLLKDQRNNNNSGNRNQKINDKEDPLLMKKVAELSISDDPSAKASTQETVDNKNYTTQRKQSTMLSAFASSLISAAASSSTASNTQAASTSSNTDKPTDIAQESLSAAVDNSVTEDKIDFNLYFDKGSRGTDATVNNNGNSKALFLCAEGDDFYLRLKDTLQSKLTQGRGEFIFELGVSDDGKSLELSETEFSQAFQTVSQICEGLSAEATILLRKNNSSVSADTSSSSSSNITGFTGHILIRRKSNGKIEDLEEVRIACVGNVDAGKSTLLGVLVSGDLDDGRGHARVNLFRHKHEIESGRTSSVGLEIMGFDSHGNQIFREKGRRPAWEHIGSHSSKAIQFMDLAGHEKYLKTTVFGMTGCMPDYVMLIVGSNAGIIGMTKEHLGLALALNVPVLVCITKVDMCPPNVLESTVKQVTKILKSNGCRKIPVFVKNMEDVILTSQNFVSERVCPVFQISNVSGFGIDLLKSFLNLLRAHKDFDVNQSVEYMINDTFSVPGVGCVVAGTLLGGVIHQGDNLLIGPDELGHFHNCQIKSIQRKRINSPVTTAGQSSSLALKKVKRSNLRKGMVLVSKDSNPVAHWEFEAEILILYHSSTIAPNYQAMIHCGNVRQAAKIVEIIDSDKLKDKVDSSDGAKVIRTGDRAIVRFRFLQCAEFMRVERRLLFREGKTKGVGKVTRLL